MLSKIKEFIGVGIVFGGTGGIFLVNLAIDNYLYSCKHSQQIIRKPYSSDGTESSESSGISTE